jgi:hypothetical protein
VTLLGDAVKLFTVGAGQEDAVTVACADAVAPQPTVAFNVYVVVDCGWAISTKPVGFAKVPTPGIESVSPVLDESLTDHDRRTVALPPIKTLLGLTLNAFIRGGGQELAVTVVCAVLWFPHPFLAVRK